MTTITKSLLSVAPDIVPRWTTREVVVRLGEAFQTMRHLPDPTIRWLRGGGDNMPEVVRSFWERYDSQSNKKTLIRPVQPERWRIDEMNEALGWVLVLDGETQGIIMARIVRAPWRSISKKMEKSESTCKRLYTAGLQAIADDLNASK